MASSLFWLGFTTLFCTWDYVVGYGVTYALRKLFQKLELAAFDWKFLWIKIIPGVAEFRIEVGDFEWRNRPVFPRYANFLEIKRLTLRVDPRPTWRFLKARIQGGKKETLTHQVYSLEVEGVTVNMERRDGEVSLWGALGLSEDLATAKFDSENVDSFDAADFDDDGDEDEDEVTNETTAPEEEEAPADKEQWSKFLGEFVVARICVRQVRARPEPLLVQRDTTDENPVVKVNVVELAKRQLRPGFATKKQLSKGKRQGLYLEELIWRVVNVVVKQIWSDKKIRKIASNATADAAYNAVSSTANSIQSSMLNVTRFVSQPQRGAIHSHSGGGAPDSSHARSLDRGGEFLMDTRTLRATVFAGRFLPPDAGSTYVKLSLGKKNVKAKSNVVAKSRDPDYGPYTVDLAPLVPGQPLKVQILQANFFGSDSKVLPALKLPVNDAVCDGKARWFAFPTSHPDSDDDDDDDVKDPATDFPDHTPAIHLSLEIFE